MFGTPMSPDAIKAETTYRLERSKRQFRSARRRQRAAQAGRPQPQHARRDLRPTLAAWPQPERRP